MTLAAIAGVRAASHGMARRLSRMVRICARRGGDGAEGGGRLVALPRMDGRWRSILKAGWMDCRSTSNQGIIDLSPTVNQ